MSGHRAAIPAVQLTMAVGDTLDPLPPWRYDEIREAAVKVVELLRRDSIGRSPATAAEVVQVRLLAWHTQEDDRPLRVDRALLWLELRGDTPAFAIVNLFRHPLEDKDWLRAWQPAFATHIEYFGGRLYETRPANADVYALLDIISNWRFTPDDDWRLLGGDVRERTWRAVIREAPARNYPGTR